MLLFSLFTQVKSQTGFSEGAVSCGSDRLINKILSENPSLNNKNNQIEEMLKENQHQNNTNNRPAATVHLPVVVHIIHNNGAENISDARVLTAIQHLNEAFANSGYYDPSSGVNTNIQFCLAKRDPSGNLTNGITRNVSSYTNMNGPEYYSSDLAVKNINRWDPTCYINIWLVNNIPGAVAGYAYLPFSHGRPEDGIVMEANFFGTSYSSDIVVIHEMGHYLGLYHTFEGGCSNTDCSTQGDKVCDTPPDNSTAWVSCNSSINSCNSDILSGFSSDQNDLVQDYMDYGNWDCMSVFTAGQAARMNAVIANIRNSLLSCFSCETPCNSPVTAGFSTSSHIAPAGTNISFTNTSVNGASYTWFVNNVQVSTAFNYSQVFTDKGTYIIRLKVVSSFPSLCREDEFSDTIRIECPVSAFFSPGFNGVTTPGQSVTFINGSTNATGQQWLYDNNPVANTTDFTVTFNTTGMHYIKLRSFSAFCSDSFQVYYSVAPVLQSETDNSFQKYFEKDTNYIEELITYTGMLTPDEYAIVGGAYNQSSNLVTKFTNTGIPVWSKNYNNVRIAKCILSNDGNYVFVGDRSGWSGQFSIIKTDTAGNLLWNTSLYLNANYSWFVVRDIIQLADSSFIIAATANPTFNTARIVLIKITTTGTVSWSKTLGPFNNTAGGLYFAGNGVYIAGGIQNGAALGFSWDGLMAKIDPANGNLIFAKKYHLLSDKSIRYSNITQAGNNLFFNGYIDEAAGTKDTVKIMSVITLDGRLVSSKSLTNELSNAADEALYTGRDQVISVATNNRLNGRIYLTRFDTSLNFVNGRKYLHNSPVVNITSISRLQSGSMVLTGNRGDQHMLMIRTLPDLTLPNCNDSILEPRISPIDIITDDVTNNMVFSTENFGNSIATISPVAARIFTYTLCKAIPVAPTCDTAVVQHYFTLSKPGSGSAQNLITALYKKQDGHIIAGLRRSFDESVIGKLDNRGDIISSRYFPRLSQIYAVKQANSSGYVVLSGVESSSDSCFILLFDGNDNLVWAKQYNLPMRTIPNIIQLSDNGFAVTSFNYLLRTDASGNVLFFKRYAPFSGATDITGIVEDGPDLVISIRSEGMLKLNSITGNNVWGTALAAEALVSNGNYYIASQAWTDSSGRIYKIGRNGEMLSAYNINVPAGAGFNKHSLMNAGSNGELLIVCNQRNADPFSRNSIHYIYLDSQLNHIKSGQAANSFILNRYAQSYAGDRKVIFGGSARVIRTMSSLLSEYCFLFHVKLTNPAGDCIFSEAPAPFISTAPVSTLFLSYPTIVDIPNTDHSEEILSSENMHVYDYALCVTGNCDSLPPCDTAGCTTYRLAAPDTICHLSNEVTIHLQKNVSCRLAASWIIETTVPYNVIQKSDSSLIIKFLQAGSATIKAKTVTSCRIYEDSLRINIFDAPDSINLGSDIALCTNSIAILKPGGGFKKYVWQDGSQDSLFSAYQPGIYHVTATDECGNLLSDTINITTEQLVFDIGNDTTLCQGDSLVLNCPPGFLYYSWSPDYNISNRLGQVITVWPFTDTMYRVFAYKNNGCAASDSIIISVKYASTIELGNDTSFCQGQVLVLDAGSGFASYAWNNGESTQAIAAASAGTYSVAAKNAEGCTSRDTLQIINVFNKPLIDIGNDTSICAGTSLQLDAGNGFISYLWQDGSTDRYYSTALVGQYKVIVKDNNDCGAADSIHIISINPAPLVSIGNDTSFCYGQAVVLSPGNGFTRYLWQDNFTGQTYSPNTAGLYWVQVTDANNCTAKDSMNVISIYSLPYVNIGNDTSICKGTQVVLDAGAGNDRYLWHDNSTSRYFTAINDGLYWVTVTNNNNCSFSDSMEIIKIIDTPAHFIDNRIGICTNQNNYIKANNRYSSYVWSTGAGSDSVMINNIGFYWLTVSNIDGCTGQESFEIFDKNCVKAIYFPNAFTPNNSDELNKVFRPKVYGEVEKYRLSIYNRNGEKVFETTSWQTGWDGTWKGRAQNPASFVWVCEYKLRGRIHQVQKGNVVLIR